MTGQPENSNQAMPATQLHLTHRAAYLRGVQYGQADVRAGRSYRPRDGAIGTEAAQQAYGLGYMDGWIGEQS